MSTRCWKRRLPSTTSTTTTLTYTKEDQQRSVENFRRIVAAIRSMDPDAAAAACVAQVEHASAIALVLLQSEGATFADG